MIATMTKAALPGCLRCSFSGFTPAVSLADGSCCESGRSVMFSSLLILPLLQQTIREHQRKHRLGNREDPGHDAGIVPALHRDLHDIAMKIPCLLRPLN